jgi:hypothetical protein
MGGTLNLSGGQRVFFRVPTSTLREDRDEVCWVATSTLLGDNEATT